jgi:tetratricopeptide (TPR) repeat protein
MQPSAAGDECSVTAAAARAEAMRLVKRGMYQEAWNACRPLAVASVSDWRSLAVVARVQLEWGKVVSDDDGRERLERAVVVFNQAIERVRAELPSADMAIQGLFTTTPTEGVSAGQQPLLELATELVELCNDLGVALYELDELDGAKRSFERALELRPGHERALCNLGLVFWSEGHERVALSTFDRSISVGGGRNPHALNNRGALRVELGETQEALSDFHTALSIDPGYATARRNRDQALAALAEPVPLPPVSDDGMTF